MDRAGTGNGVARRRRRWPLIVATLGGGAVLAAWWAFRTPEVELPSFPGASRFSHVTPTFRLPTGTVPATHYIEVKIPGPWEEAVAKLDRDLTAQGFRLTERDRLFRSWSRGKEGATAVMRWKKGEGRTVQRFSLSRPANAVEEAGRWFEDQRRRFRR